MDELELRLEVQPVTIPDPELTPLERMDDVCDDDVDVDICLTFLQLPYELVLSEL